VSQRTRNNIDNARKQFWLILDSDTCKGIKDTPFGFVQAGDELITHYLAAERGQDSAMRRQLLKPQPRKLQLLNIVREVANV